LIYPRALSLPCAKGRVITPKGFVSVEWENASEKFSISIDAPLGIPVIVRLPDGSEKAYPEGGSISVHSNFRR
jgi:hypothetical protein